MSLGPGPGLLYTSLYVNALTIRAKKDWRWVAADKKIKIMLIGPTDNEYSSGKPHVGGRKTAVDRRGGRRDV
jgi:hypothetical protein